MTFRERNEAAFLEKMNLPGSALFSGALPAGTFELIETPSGCPTAKYDGVFLHGRHDPVREAERLVGKELTGKKPGAVVMYGFALGYHAERILTDAPESDVFIIEPDFALFRNALASRDLTRIILSPRTAFLIGNTPDEVASILEPALENEHLVFRIRSVYEKDREYYERTDAALGNLLRRKEINRNTLRRFGRLWVRNLVANLPLFARTPGIGRIASAFEGVPACVAAAGPSLDSVLPLLPEIRKRALIVAVDTSLRACLRAGVDPDFTIVVDPQYWNTRHLDWAGESSGILISESSTHPRIFRKSFGMTLFCSSIFPLGEYLEKRTGERGRLGAGGSVATSAWDFARFLGCGPVFMAGLDLGFPDRETHFKGSFFEHRIHTHSTRLSPGETSSFLALHDAGPFPAESNDGGTVLTDNRLIVYRQWFESQMKMHPECTTKTLSRKGVRIDGMEHTASDELLSFPDVRKKLDVKLREIRAASSAKLPDERAFEAAISSLTEELEALDTLAERGRVACGELRERFRAGRRLDPVLGKLSEIDGRIMGFAARDVAGFLLSAVRDGLPTGKGDDGLSVIDNSETLYRDLHESVSYHRSLLERGRRTGGDENGGL